MSVRLCSECCLALELGVAALPLLHGRGLLELPDSRAEGLILLGAEGRQGRRVPRRGRLSLTARKPCRFRSLRGPKAGGG